MEASDLADGKVFDQSDLTDCLRDQDFRIDRRGTDTGIDFTARQPVGTAQRRHRGRAHARRRRGP